MLRLFVVFGLCIYSSLVAAKNDSLYQIDLIVFTHTMLNKDQPNKVLPNLSNKQVISLDTHNDGLTPYHLRPFSFSKLQNEYWTLKHQKDYHVLGHYSWLQPTTNQSAVALPHIVQQGWDVQGTVRIQQNNYYALNTKLIFSAQNNPQDVFIFSQKQFLKPNTVYYIDHPQAGMIIEVHQLT